MASRWQKRSIEDKQKILSNIENQSKVININNKSKGNYKDYFDDKSYMNILKKSELPLYCKKCGWTTSQNYTLSKFNGPLGDFNMVTGTCIKCGLPANCSLKGQVYANMQIIYGAICINLIRQNRLVDNRKKGEVGDIESFHLDERR